MKPARLFTYQGVTLSLHGWSTRTGIKYATLFARYRAEWPIDRMLCRPTKCGPDAQTRRRHARVIPALRDWAPRRQL